MYGWKDALEDVRRGRNKGFTYFNEHYASKLRAHVRAKLPLSPQDAEEVVQDALYRFFKNVLKGNHLKFEEDDEKNGEVSLLCYLKTTAYHEGIRKLEKIKGLLKPFPIDEEDIDAIENISQSSDEELWDWECVEEVLLRFQQDAPTRYHALTLQVEGWSIKEIAKELNRTEGATRQFLYECRKKFRPHLQECRNNPGE